MSAVYALGAGGATRGDGARPRKLLGQLRDVLRAKHYSYRTEQEHLSHKDVSTTMIYTHLLQRGACGVTSPLDRL